ncbi:MAG: T9SS type A sorting domain-containing protein [Bacteroidetes bacterium]|nr:T9SS type A sorting domain-containing protein [Bacteroidota bacterium]
MRKLLLLLIGSTLCFFAEAQSFLKFTQTQFNISTVDTSTAPINDSIYNTDTVPFRGQVFFEARIDTAQTSIRTDSVDFSALPLDSNGTPATARSIFIHVPYNNPLLIGGPTGVVIWPLYLGGHAGPGDSIYLTVTVRVVTGLEDAAIARVYLTQSGDMLDVHFGDYQENVKQVSFYNIEGRQMYDGTATQAQHIPVAPWSRGLYFCEIQTFRGERRTIKFILQ